jgi:hypothetical protein
MNDLFQIYKLTTLHESNKLEDFNNATLVVEQDIPLVHENSSISLDILRGPIRFEHSHIAQI